MAGKTSQRWRQEGGWVLQEIRNRCSGARATLTFCSLGEGSGQSPSSLPGEPE